MSYASLKSVPLQTGKVCLSSLARHSIPVFAGSASYQFQVFVGCRQNYFRVLQGLRSGKMLPCNRSSFSSPALALCKTTKKTSLAGQPFTAAGKHNKRIVWDAFGAPHAGVRPPKPVGSRDNSDIASRCAMRYILLMIKSFKHKGLKQFFETGKKAGIQAKHAKKLRMQLTAIDTAQVLDDIDLPGFSLHPLRGNRSGIWSISVSGNWRVTFEFRDGNAYILNYEDYH